MKYEVTTAKSKHADANFVRIKKPFLQKVVEAVEMEGIPPDLILNWDQTAVSTSTWNMDHQGAKHVSVAGEHDKRP